MISIYLIIIIMIFFIIFFLNNVSLISNVSLKDKAIMLFICLFICMYVIVKIELFIAMIVKFWRVESLSLIGSLFIRKINSLIYVMIINLFYWNLFSFLNAHFINEKENYHAITIHLCRRRIFICVNLVVSFLKMCFIFLTI